MQKNSTGYMYLFALLITLGCGVLLAVVSEATKEARQANVKVEKMSNILSTVNFPMEKGMDQAAIEDAYKKYISEEVVDANGNVVDGVVAFNIDLKTEQSKKRENPEYKKNLPIFIYTNPENNEKYYVLPMRGAGLWGAVWGYISLASDFTTVYGVKFDHESETPGLGAEITTEWFQAQFPDKKAYDKDNNVALTILKGKGNELNEYTVDGISGATITGSGVNAMFKADLAQYTSYFNKLKNN
ncbi:NADH:ubiquinone reductase (Na(+)-transporting) subunit C [bacterium]|nr:NADH:ubiquinone reductase (Na(+)-transporting) subunit C [bacterium]